MSITKTILIFEEVPERLSYLVYDGDLTRFEGVYIGSYNEENAKLQDELQDELSTLIHDSNGLKYERFETFPTEIFRQSPDTTTVITCGIIL